MKKKLKTVSEWNEERQSHYESMANYPKFTELLCNKCNFLVLAEYHVDHSITPPRRQVVCSNPDCRQIDYMII